MLPIFSKVRIWLLAIWSNTKELAAFGTLTNCSTNHYPHFGITAIHGNHSGQAGEKPFAEIIRVYHRVCMVAHPRIVGLGNKSGQACITE